MQALIAKYEKQLKEQNENYIKLEVELDQYVVLQLC